jgi:glycosyltransferase involved in cell wall biosynthesis
VTLRRVHQVVPTLATGDAVGGHTLRLRDLLRGAGVESEIFTDDLDPRLAHEARPLADLPAPAGGASALIYQCSIGNGVVDRLLDRDEPLVVNYHNLTPAAQLLRWAPDMAHLVSWGRHQLRALARRAVLGIGDSQFNSAELVEAGFDAVATAPVLLDLPCDAVVPDRPLDGRRWLFVGRIVPNKAQHDLVAALAWYRAVHDPAATLRLVGGDASAAYRSALDQLVADLQVGDAVTFA